MTKIGKFRKNSQTDLRCLYVPGIEPIFGDMTDTGCAWKLQNHGVRGLRARTN